MALNPQFPNYANGAAGTEVIFYTVVGGLPLYRLPPKMVDTGFGAALVGGGSTPNPPDSDEFAPPKIISPGTLQGIFIEDQTITHTPPVVVGDVTSQTITWFVRKSTGSVKVAENVSTYTLQAADVGGFLFVQVHIEGPTGEDTDSTQSYGPILPSSVPVPVLTATFTPSEEVGTAASLAITACTNGTVNRVQVVADQSGVIQNVPVSSLPVTVTQSGASLVPYVGQYLIFKVTVVDGLGNNIFINYTCGPIDGSAPVITGTGSIAGVAKVGETLTFTPPSVTGIPTPTVSYNWYRQNGGSIIAGGLTYVPTNDDLGQYLYVTTVATNLMGGDTATTLDFGPILGTAPEVVDPGVLSPDSVRINEVITLNPIPEFSGNPTPSVSWVWRDALDEDRVLQVGGTTYRAKATDIGKSIIVASTGTNLSGSVNAYTNEASVEAEAPAVDDPSVLFDTTPEVRQQIGAKKATFTGFPDPVVTSFGFWDYTDPMNPVQLVDGEDVTTYTVKDEDFGKEIAFVTVAENSYGSATSVSTISAPVTGFLVVTGSSQLSYEPPVDPGTVLSGGQASFSGVPTPSISQFGFAYDNGDGTYTPILSSAGQTTYTIVEGDAGTSIVFYTTATNAANPAGLTSYSDSTGPVDETYQFVSTGGVVSAGPAPIVGETLTINYAVTQPRNQKNTPAGPVTLTWNWISDEDPGTPLTTPNAQTYTVKPSDYGKRIGLSWKAVYFNKALEAQSGYSQPVGGNAPAVLTSGSVAGDVSAIPSTLTLTPATFSGTNVTVSWEWVNEQGLAYQQGGLTLLTNSSMAGRQVCVKTTATNFAGSVTDTSNFSDVIGNGSIPVFSYNGTVTGPLDYFRSTYNLDPARAETAGKPDPVTWEWITSSSIDGSTDVITIPNEDNRLAINTSGLPAYYFENRYLMVKSRAENVFEQITDAVSSAIGPLGRLPVLTQKGTIVGTFQVDAEIQIDKEWAFSDATVVQWNWVYSDDLTIPDSDVIFQVGGNTAVIPPEALGKYIGMVGSGTNAYGTATAPSAVYGPVQPNPNPIITKPGKIIGDLIYGSQQPAQFLLPEVRNSTPSTQYTWRWEVETSPGQYDVLQYGGTLLTLDWTSTTGGGDNVFGTNKLNKRISVAYTVENIGAGQVSGRVFADNRTDAFLTVSDGSGEVAITGGTKSATGPAVQSGMLLTAIIPKFAFLTRGWVTNSNPGPIDPVKGVAPRVTWDWIYADTASGISSVTVTKAGCYPTKPEISVPYGCLKGAELEIAYAPNKGVYVINGIEPVGVVNNQGTIAIQPVAGYPAGAPTVGEVTYVTREDGSVWISQISIADPGYGYEDTTSITVTLNGVPITNQQFVPTYGFRATAVDIIDAGLGYTSETLPILVNSPWDRFPLIAQGNCVDTAQVVASNTLTYRPPQDSRVSPFTPPLPNDGFIGVSVIAAGTSSSVPPVLLQSSILYEYFAPTDQTPVFLQQPTIYGVPTSESTVTCNVAFAGWRNTDVPITGSVMPRLAEPAELNAYPIYPTKVTYTWEWENPDFPGTWFDLGFGTRKKTVDLSQVVPSPPGTGRLRCKVEIQNGNSSTVVQYTPAVPYTDNRYGETQTAPSVNWCGYFSVKRSSSGGTSWSLDSRLNADGSPLIANQINQQYLNVDPGDIQLWVITTEPNGSQRSERQTRVPTSAEPVVSSNFYFADYNAATCIWAEIRSVRDPNVLVCRSNVIGTAPTTSYRAEGMADGLQFPGREPTNSITLSGSGNWVGLAEPKRTYTWDENGLQGTFIQANPPIGNITRGANPGIPYSAIDYRSFAGGIGNNDDIRLAPTCYAKFNPNVSIPAPPTVEYYYNYKQYAAGNTRSVIGFQWDWRIADLTTIGLVSPFGADRWNNPSWTGLIGPINGQQPQLLYNAGPVAVPYYVNGNGFQYSADSGASWQAAQKNLIPQDQLRWALYNQSQVTSVLPFDVYNLVPAWWVIANPDGSKITRVAPMTGAINEAWNKNLLIDSAWLGKMVGIEIEPSYGNGTSSVVWPTAVPQYFWAGYVSTGRQDLNPPAPSV